ncbi:M14 family metallopeptidase [Paenibacillus sp. FJAT-26967]|uniref:M14 family metallopeptidase n=1 Tax=Paenibacillus sp. FJAT-26967 TaxID=1729690 RepID=UPI0008381C84|nr:M14 family metallopeptidase [Paenibacillus sp. FJAT-26967]
MSFRHVVQEGETLQRIARFYAVSLLSLTVVNPQLSPDEYVVPGQVILIPPRLDHQYITQSGDTWEKVSQRFGMTVQELQDANSWLDTIHLRTGVTIDLPPAGSLALVRTDQEYGYSELLTDLDKLKERYPFLKEVCIGTSVLGRKIPAVRIGGGPREIHVNASFHANEWMTSLLAMKFLEEYAGAIDGDGTLWGVSARKLLSETSLWVVPMVNPDGVELVLGGIYPAHPRCEQLYEWNGGSFDFRRWKANVNGVDLNDQFPAHWEDERERRAVAGPGPRDYTGEGPLTEPEAQAIASFTRSRNFACVVALHTQGREIYWNYRDYEPEDAEFIALQLSLASGYKSVKLSGSDAGYKDWFIQEFRRPGFTIESGMGLNPLPLSQFPYLYEETARLLVKALTLPL